MSYIDHEVMDFSMFCLWEESGETMRENTTDVSWPRLREGTHHPLSYSTGEKLTVEVQDGKYALSEQPRIQPHHEGGRRTWALADKEPSLLRLLSYQSVDLDQLVHHN